MQHESVGYFPEARGAFAGLRRRAARRGFPSADAAELRVHAVGLNFRDILNVLGMYPGSPGDPGADVAGVLTNNTAAPDSRHITTPVAGCSVYGMGEGVLRSYVVAAKEALQLKPANVDFSSSCAAGTVFTTGACLMNRRSGLVSYT